MSTTTITKLSAETANTTLIPEVVPGSRPTGFASVATGGDYKGIPQFSDLLKKREWQLEHMAAAMRNFARNGYCDGTAGHMSVRDPIDENTFWINPIGVHFAMLTAADMVHVDENGKIIGGNTSGAVNAAGFMIHAAIHIARPDVTAAAHTHAKHAKAWSTFGLPLDNINQDTCMFFNVQAVYKNFGGVVLQKEEGQNIAKALGPKGKVAVLQNHGLLTCGETVDECAHLFNTVERACEVQLMVEATGLEKKFVPDEEARYTNSVLGDPEVLFSQFQPDYKYEVFMSNGAIRLL